MMHLLYSLFDDVAVFNVFKYITFRSFGAGVTSFAISVFLGGKFINFLKMKQFKENIRQDGPATHLSKKGTPTMGGLFIVVAILVSSIVWMNLSAMYVWMVLIFTAGFALIGYMDDRQKIFNGKGVSARSKILCWVVTDLQCL